MTETSMVEKVANAMRVAMNDDDEETLVPFDKSVAKEDWLKCARAAIKAMREPTEAMREGAASLVMQTVPHDDTGHAIAFHAYTAMIDAALDQSGEG